MYYLSQCRKYFGATADSFKHAGVADGYCMMIKNFCVVHDSEPWGPCYLALVVTVFAEVLSVMADNVFMGYCRQGSPHNCRWL